VTLEQIGEQTGRTRQHVHSSPTASGHHWIYVMSESPYVAPRINRLHEEIVRCAADQAFARAALSRLARRSVARVEKKRCGARWAAALGCYA